MKLRIRRASTQQENTYSFSTQYYDKHGVPPTVLVLVLVPTILIVGLVVVLHGRKTGWSDLVCHRWLT
ncbi:hypothetical protein Tco_0279903, partial [Tanacetum coccineum]